MPFPSVRSVFAASQVARALFAASLLPLIGCTPPETTKTDTLSTSVKTDTATTSAKTDTTSTSGAASASPQVESTARWAAGCNDGLLSGPFALDRATDFKVSPQDLKRIQEVVDEVKGGYGGTLVTAPPDKVLDSPAFLAHYLRAFSKPEAVPRYDYHFERILARLSGAETVLDDPRLDWDIWRAYLLFENSLAASGNGNEFKTVENGDTYVHGLDSAKDLLWAYLTYNAKSIQDDKDRLGWWIESLTQAIRAPGGRPLRRWFLLQLVASSDTKTSKLIEKDDADDQDELFPTTRPDPFDPFLVLEGLALFPDDQKGEQPVFAEAIKKITDSQKLSYELWGIDPATMPPTKALNTDLAPRLSQFSPATVLSQESWSDKPQYFRTYFSRPVGRRSAHFNVGMPQHDSKDGVFFFTYNARLYVWRKAQMDDGVIQMLHHCQLIDDETHTKFLAAGYKRLSVLTEDD